MTEHGTGQQIESIFHQALERDPAQRDAWLIEACQGDSARYNAKSRLFSRITMRVPTSKIGLRRGRQN